MKDYTYSNKEVELVKHLLNNTPNKIWYGFDWYVFDYIDYHLTVVGSGEEADSQNEKDEAKIAKLTREEKKFELAEHATLICENKKIDKALLVQTFLYFTTVRNYSESEQFAKRTIQKIKTAISGKKDVVGDLLSKSHAQHEEIICHPKSDHARQVDPEYGNQIGVGLLLEIDGKYLRAFLENNGFGFHIWDDKYFFELDEIEEDKELYEFINVEH